MNCELMLTDDTPAYMFNVYKNQPSRQTGSRNVTGPKTLPTIWGTYMKLVIKYQISAINNCWEKCDDKYLGMDGMTNRQTRRTDRQTEGRMGRGKTVYPPPVEWGYKNPTKFVEMTCLSSDCCFSDLWHYKNIKSISLVQRRQHHHLNEMCSHWKIAHLALNNNHSLTEIVREPLWTWSYHSWIYNYLCNQSLSPLMLLVRISIRVSVQHYVIKFVSDLRQVDGFHRAIQFPPTIKPTATI